MRWLLTALFASLLGASASGQHALPLRGGFTLAPAAADGGRPDEAAFRPAEVPGTFEAALGKDFDGIAWYRRTLALPTEWRGQRVWLRCRAAATDATVFVNGQRVGQHLGGWTPFHVRIDQAARFDGGDLLELRVDEKVGHNTQGFLPIIQPHFGGLWQDLELVAVPSDGAALDLDRTLLFGDGEAGALRADVALLAAAPGRALSVAVSVLDGAHPVAEATWEVDASTGRGAGTLPVRGARRWSPRTPHLYRARVQLLDRATGEELDRVERRVGFRALRADGRQLFWNDEPLSVRGVLHWGFSPPAFAPHPQPAAWRRELEALRARGFNLVKCCLWVPPREFYELCDEIGVLVWQEYPTWHPRFTPEFRAELEREFDEFFHHDRSHPSVAFRSLTCETGQSADLAILQALYDRCHALVPDALVIDDSSWISWSRVGDFYDDHPYGNNRWWPGKLASFDAYLREHGEKPLLLGECIAADTWFDLAAWDRDAPEGAWWAPLCLDAQRGFERGFRARFGARALRALLPESRDYAMRNRKVQIERLRQDLPHAGYVVSVVRDFPLARMGLVDDLGAAKWDADAWRWHGETVLCLDVEQDLRAFQAGRVELGLRVAHHGARELRAPLRVVVEAPGLTPQDLGSVRVTPGTVSSPVPFAFELELAAGGPRRVRVHAELGRAASNAWDLWLLPPPPPAAPEVRVVDALTPETLAFLEGGGCVLHRATGRDRSLRSKSTWFLRGAAFARPPAALAQALPAAFLRELQTFDLETGRVLDVPALRGQLDPWLAVWDTHDLAEVRSHELLAAARVGGGALVVSTLDPTTAAGEYVERVVCAALAGGLRPEARLTEATVARLRGAAGAEQLPLPDWQLRLDPEDLGLAAGWGDGGPATGWQRARAGTHWENLGFAADGVGWYRTEFEVPADWAGRTVTAVFEGVDDSFHAWLNGRLLGSFGDPATGETVWLQRTTVDASAALRPGERNRLVLRVVDHQGAGGLWKPVFLTTGPADPGGDLLH